jgi:putative endopeptidase
MRKQLKYLIFPAFLLFAFSCSTPGVKNTMATPDALVAHIDSTVRPGDDFFLFSNGKWFKQNPIPASEPSNGLWQLIQDTINAQVRTICQTAGAMQNAPKGSNKQKIGDFYFTGMDSVSRNQAGLKPLKSDFERIDGIKDVKGVVQTAAWLQTIGARPLFNFAVGQDDKISSKNAVFVSQGGLSLPDRNFYFDTDAQAVKIREKFKDHVQNMFRLMGYDDKKSASAAAGVVKLETAIAKTSRKREDTRDPLKNYNKYAYKQFTDNTPNIDWAGYLPAAGLTKVDSVIVGQPEFLTALNGYLKTFPLDDWKNYLKFQMVRTAAASVDDKTYLEFFNFYATVLRGIKEPKPRWDRVVRQTNGSLGELIGQVYVAEYLPKGTKEKLMEIGKAIKEVYAERIKALDWMSAATKEKALHKLSTVIMKVGYPDKWKDLSSMTIDRSSYVQNVFAANKWAFQDMISKYGKPVDRTEWGMTPQTYNAYYNPSNNEIVVPGCNIIVPGYERTLADDAILYSVIGGSTFGHEITHGFDDQGAKYDAEGNLHNWWTPEDSIKFTNKTKLIVRQFSEFIAVDSLHVNGELTQGENIADLGGIMMGYEAFKKTPQYKNRQVVAGLNPDQRFFIGYAMAWMINTRPEAIANQVRSNEHAPPKFRVIGPLADMPEFYAVFGIKKGDAMWREDSLRVKIW